MLTFRVLEKCHKYVSGVFIHVKRKKSSPNLIVLSDPELLLQESVSQAVVQTVELSLRHLHVLADDVKSLLVPVLLPTNGEAVKPRAVPRRVAEQMVREQDDFTEQNVRYIGLLIAAFDVDLVLDDVSDDLLLLLTDLLFGSPVLALLFGSVQQTLLLGQLGSLDAIFGNGHQVVDGFRVAAPPAVILQTNENI